MNTDIEQQRQFFQLIDAKPTENKEFEFQSHQLFAEYYINPFTVNRRVHNMSGTGLGKTMSALLVAKQFIDAGRPVFIIGFQEERFIDELLHQPSLGFVTEADVKKLKYLEQSLLSDNQEMKNTYMSFRSSLKSRLKAIKFFGYKLLTLRLYSGNYSANDENANVFINFEFIRSFNGSLIICDEIQNAYNSIEKNNWGRSLQLIFNIMGPNIHVLTISSTPFLISSEMRDFLNMLNETPGINIGGLQYSTARKDQLRIANDIVDFEYETIKHLKLPMEIDHETITRVLKGKILFMPDAGSEYIPRKIFHGVEIRGIPYLKFYIVPMSDEQEKATRRNSHNHQYRYLGGILNNFKIKSLKDVEVEDGDEGAEGAERSEIHELSDNTSDEIETLKRENGIIIKHTGDGIYYSGDFLQLDKLGKYSAKYVELFKLIRNAKRGKILVYHYDVHGVGVLTIEEICRYNGIIDTNTEPNEYTRCTKCFEFRLEHHVNGAAKDCDEFLPFRFMSIHSKMGATMIRNTLIRYDLPSNRYGDDVRLLIGSRKIREGIDFKAVRTQITLSLPVNISMFIQLLGRAARQKSHILLGPDEQFVDQYILVCGYKSALRFNESLQMWECEGEHTPEINDYLVKMQDYLKVQEYMRVLNQIAADVHIFKTNRLIETNIRLLNPDVTDVENFRGLGSLPYKPVFKELPDIRNVNNTVYNALKYNREEILTMNFLIRNALAKHKIWKIEDLWNFILKSNGTPNPSTFNKGNYIICLQHFPKITIVGEYIINSNNIDIDCFSREDNIRMFSRIIKVNRIKDDEIIEQIVDLVKHKRTPDGRLFLRHTYLLYEKYNIETHVRILKHAIIGDNKDVILFYSSLFDLYSAKDLQVSNLLHTPDRIIGFKLELYVYHITSDTSDEFKQLILQRDTASMRRDNDIIIGLYTEEMEFKLRENFEGNTEMMKKIKCLRKNKIDVRKLSKGIMCSSVKKERLYTIAKKLGIEDASKKRNLCELIKAKLIANEEKKIDNLKWFYLQG
jgi:hypothetical protein